MITERQIAIYMFSNLQKQAYEWQWVIKGSVEKEVKAAFNHALQANTKLMKMLESEIGKGDPEMLEAYWENSEVFSKALTIIKDTATPEKKQELIDLFIHWVNGDVKVIEDENSKKVA